MTIKRSVACRFVGLLLLLLCSINVSASDKDCFLPDIPPAKLNLMLGSDKAAEAMYEARRPSLMPCSEQPIIPKLIHQIWIGPRELPPLRKAFMETWKRHHPIWTYKLWTDEDVRNWEGEFHLKDLYDKAYTIQEKADILRLNIIYKYGGLYVDTDVECLRNFSPLHHKYKFYTSAETTLQLFASAPKNPLFEKIFHTIRARWEEVEQSFLKRNASLEYQYTVVRIAADRCQGTFWMEAHQYCKREPKSILLPYNILSHKVNKQILFCARMKLLSVMPALQNRFNNMFILEHAMAVQRWGTIRGTTLYNGIEEKVKIKMPQDSLYRQLRNWIHNNIDVHFVGCGDTQL